LKSPTLLGFPIAIREHGLDTIEDKINHTKTNEMRNCLLSWHRPKSHDIFWETLSINGNNSKQNGYRAKMLKDYTNIVCQS